MTRVVVQRGPGSNTSHKRSITPSPSNSSHPSSLLQTSHSNSGHVEEEKTLEAKETEAVQIQAGDPEGRVTDSKLGDLHGFPDSRTSEGENRPGYNELSGYVPASSRSTQEAVGRKEQEGTDLDKELRSEGTGWKELTGGCDSEHSRALGISRDHEEYTRSRCSVKNNGDEVLVSGETMGLSGEAQQDKPQVVHQFPVSPSRSFDAVTQSSECSGPSSSYQLAPLLRYLPDPGVVHASAEARPNSRSDAATGYLCDNVPATSQSAPFPPSRRGALAGPTRGGNSKCVSRVGKPSRISPTSSSPTSPKTYGEGDGNNSEDEHVPSVGYEYIGERERHFEMELRRVKSLEVRRMAEDGNCLFRAVADQVYGDAEMYDDTRQMCIDYMEKDRDHFSQFVTESFTAYCKRKRRDKVFGNNLEIQAMAEMYNRPIHIHSYSTDPINIFHGSYQTELPPIRLSYHRGNHYNSLIDPSKPAIGAGLGFGSLRGRNVDRDQVKAALKAQQDQQIEKALLAEGRFYSDLELTEQEIERMVMEASRAEFLAEESNLHLSPWCEETSTSSAAEPSSSGSTFCTKLEALTTNLGISSDAGAGSTGLSSNLRMLLSMGFAYSRVMEASSIFDDDLNNMLCYLLETEGTPYDGENVYRMKGKAAER